MTLREIDVLLSRMSVRRHNNHAVQAALHGVKIPLRTVATQVKKNTDFTPEEASAAEKAMQEAIMRRRVEKDFA